MRKLMLVTAFVLVSVSAQAGISRGLTLASTETSVVAEPPKQVDTPKAVEAPKPDEARKPDEGQKAEAPKYVERPKPQRESTEARVIRELHRHGIYW